MWIIPVGIVVLLAAALGGVAWAVARKLDRAHRDDLDFLARSGDRENGLPAGPQSRAHDGSGS